MQISNNLSGVFPLKPVDTPNRLPVVVPVSTSQDSQQARFIRTLAQLDNAEFLPTTSRRALPAPVQAYLQIASFQDRNPYSGLIDETV